MTTRVKGLSMRHRWLRAALGILTVLAYPSMASAGYDEAMAAFAKKDYQTALREARQAAEAGHAHASWLLAEMHAYGFGVPASKTESAFWYQKAAEGGMARAFERLAWMHARGDGVPKDPDKALDYARRGARLGDAGSNHFVYVALISGPLRWLDAAGKPDAERYRALAARPVAERALDTEAYDALYRSAEKNWQPALFTLVLATGATVGEGNRERLLTAWKRLALRNHPTLQRYVLTAQRQEQLGATLTSPQLFLDAQLPQAVAAMIAACGVRDPKEGPKQLPELIKTAVTRPLNDAVWLPSQVPGHEHAYLVAGNWEETWTYRGCDRMADVVIEFKADGMGGATFSSRQEARQPAAPPSS